VMAATYPRGTLGFAASLLASTLYQWHELGKINIL